MGLIIPALLCTVAVAGMWLVSQPSAGAQESGVSGQDGPSDEWDWGQFDPRYRSVTTADSLRALDGRQEIESGDVESVGADRLDEALNELAGISTVRASGLGTSASVDGLPASAVNVLIDGVPIARALNSRAGPATDLASVPIDAAQIERIEISRGIGPAGSADAGGVVVNIITRDVGDEVRVNIAASNASGDAEVSLERGASGSVVVPFAHGAYAELAVQYSQELSTDVDRDDTPDRPDQLTLSTNGGLGWRRSSGERLEVGVRYSSATTTRRALIEDAQEAAEVNSPASLNGLFDDSTDYSVAEGRVDGVWQPRENLELTHITSASRQLYRFDKERVRDGEEETVHRTTDLTLRQSLLARVWVGDHRVEPEMLLRGSITERSGDDSAFLADAAAVGLGVGDRWAVTDVFDLRLRGYVDYHSDFGMGGNAGVGFAVAPIEELLLHASTSLTRRSPTPEELYFTFDHNEVGYILEGNEGLDPERLAGLRGGFELNVQSWMLGSEAFYNSLNGAIAPEDVGTDEVGTTRFRYRNFDRLRSAGLTTSTSVEAIPGGLSIGLRYAWLPHSEVDSADGRLPLTTRHDVRLRIDGAWVDDRVQAFALLRHRTALEGQGGYGLTTTNIGASVESRSGLRFGLVAQNLTNASHGTYGPFAGRTLLASLRYRFTKS